MKRSLIILFFLNFALNVFCTEKYVNSYRNANYYFENNDYGKALTYAEDAITLRKEYTAKQLETLKKSLSSKAVKTAGDNINNILNVLESRNEYDSINLINYYLKLKGENAFNNSMSSLLEFINKEESYPEAQFLIGKIYKIEGEYSVAETYYLLALDNKDVLDIPTEKYEILYELAEISKLQNDDDKFEARLLNILLDDKSSPDEALNKAMLHTISTNNGASVEKYFQLYRARDYNSLKAYMYLEDFYNEKGYSDKALKYSSLSVITGFTKVIEAIENRDSNYIYTNFADFLEEVNKYSDIVDWGISNDFWKSFNDLAEISNNNGYDIFAKKLLAILAKDSPQEYWQKDAVIKLSKFE